MDNINNTTAESANSDPFDDLMNLEEIFYSEGYALGEAEGSKAGRIEGRVFGLEKGFEKFMEAGRLHGRSVVWAGRFPHHEGSTTTDTATSIQHSNLPSLSNNLRLEKHIRVLYALSEPASLSTDNTEEAVSDFDDRLKRAHAKIKIIERLVGEDVPSTGNLAHQIGGQASADQNIEDVDILKARH